MLKISPQMKGFVWILERVLGAIFGTSSNKKTAIFSLSSYDLWQEPSTKIQVDGM